MDIDAVEEEDDDPVIASYDVFITPQVKEQLYLLQYPTRDRSSPYDAAHTALPNELRIKPKTGFVEVDIGVTTEANFDKIKGLQWGQALKHAKDARAKGFGLSAGFGKGNEDGSLKVLVSGEGDGRRRKDDGDAERMLREFETKKDRGAVLVKQTLGGQVRRPEEGRPYYMVGTFRGNEIHLSEVVGTAQMRPQFHHIDAQAQITKTTIARTTVGSTKAPNAKTQEQRPMAATAALAAQRSKAPSDSQVSTMYEATDRFLDAAADENWMRCRYRDEEETDAFGLFEETMVLRDTGTARPLRSDWGNSRYMDEINKPVIEEKKKKTAVATARKGRGPGIRKTDGGSSGASRKVLP